ncbi:Hypothetical predicted protein [Paramuricea clavata]|uniref:Ribosomal protein eL8/eL30/eS12/Gadd45 domain-containing protein n=1 Tax=Paramuricea clavata TaxID=317549 RepID=A0A7D9L880_PARCT|nr:Hypothetical predicted protein [Paramuricea clavata]
MSNDENNIETDFPALGASIEQHSTPSTVWNKPFGVSFSEKLKSNNTSRLSSDRPKEESAMKSKENKDKIMNKQTRMLHNERANKKSADNITKPNIVNQTSEKDITKSQSDDEGFFIVRNKARRLCETVEWNDSKSLGREKRRVAWGETPYEDQTKEKTKGVKKFSENRSKTQRGGPTRNTLCGDVQKHRSSEDWRSSRNITEKEPRENNISKDRGDSRQSFKAGKDYSTLKSTLGEDKNVNLREKQNSGKKKNFESVENVDKRITTTYVEARAPLSYSDILKSKPNIQLPDPGKVDGNARGILRVPGEASEDENGQEVEEEGKTKKKKKKKKKKKSAGETAPQPVKKSKEALTLDFSDMFMKIMESSTAKKKPVMRTGGFLPAQAPLPPKETRITKVDRTHQAANVLDSTAPIVFRSKEREFPKKKKPSAMRKILTKEREEKKMIREGKSPTEPSSDEENSEKESSDEQHLDSDEIDPGEVKKSIHSRKFREYCDQDLDYDINGVVITLLKELIRFQDRLYHKDPIKAKARRRFVCGLREVCKHAKLKKLKCVIVTPNLEPTKSKGGLDDLLSNIIDVCHSQNVPVIFALNRQVLGRVLLKKVPVSIVGIFYYDGAQDYFKSLMKLTEVARETYKDKFNEAREKFLSEKQTAKDIEQIKTALESTEIQEVEDQTIQSNDAENTETRFAVNEQICEDGAEQITRDLAAIEANLHLTEMQEVEDQTIQSNDAENTETRFAVNEQICGDEAEQITRDLAASEVNLHLTEIQKDEDQTIQSNDAENTETRLVVNEEICRDGEEQITRDLAAIEENLHLTEIQKDEDQTIENNDAENTETRFAVNEQICEDRVEQIARDLAAIEENLHSTETQKYEDQIITTDTMNVETNIEEPFT